jgi:hypothetical protein
MSDSQNYFDLIYHSTLYLEKLTGQVTAATRFVKKSGHRCSGRTFLEVI